MRFLILTSYLTGGGHRSVAEAVAGGIRSIAADATIEIVDLFTHGSPGIADHLTRTYSPLIRYLPSLYGTAFHLTNRHAIYEVVAAIGVPRLTAKAVEVLSAHSPDVIVNTHPLLNRPAILARSRLRASTPLVATVTEFVTVHRSWVEPEIDCFTVVSEAAAALVERYGADPARVHLTGLPIGTGFSGPFPDRRELRKRLGLEPDRPTFLCIGGGEGAGRLDQVVPALARSGIDLQLIVVCGRNQRLYRRLAAASLPVPVSLHAFTREIPTLMAAADAIVTKGGPQTLAESLVVGRPVIVTQLVPGQEEGNDEFVVSHGVGFKGRTTAAVLDAAKRLATEPELLTSMSNAARQLARPEAAVAVARLLLELAEPSRSSQGR